MQHLHGSLSRSEVYRALLSHQLWKKEPKFGWWFSLFHTIYYLQKSVTSDLCSNVRTFRSRGNNRYSSIEFKNMFSTTYFGPCQIILCFWSPDLNGSSTLDKRIQFILNALWALVEESRISPYFTDIAQTTQWNPCLAKGDANGAEILFPLNSFSCKCSFLLNSSSV